MISLDKKAEQRLSVFPNVEIDIEDCQGLIMHLFAGEEIMDKEVRVMHQRSRGFKKSIDTRSGNHL